MPHLPVTAFRPCQAVTLVCLAAALFAGCGRRETPVEVGNRDGTLHYGTTGEPSELDPHVINASGDYQIIPALFEGLLDPGPQGFVPRVAERWEASADNLTFTFRLRSNAKWSNGDPVTADDFLYAFRRALSPGLASQYTFLFHAVRGADDYATGKLTDFSQVGFAAPDPRTLVVTLAQPTPYFLGIVAGNPIWFPIHRGTIEAHGRIDQRGTNWTRPGHFVGNGPFVLKSWQPNDLLVFEKSPHYWNAAQVRLNRVHVHPIDNADTEERAFRAGQLHVAHVSTARANAYLAERSPRLVRTPIISTSFINLNTARPPLNDARVRRALALALDRRRLSERIQPARTQPAFGVVPTAMPGYTTAHPLQEDAPAARALLAEAGFPSGANFPPLEFSCETRHSIELVEAIQETWRTKLGINVSINRREGRTHWSGMQLKQFDLALAGWTADYLDASTFLDMWLAGGGWNFTNWADAQYDALNASAAAERDPTIRLQRLQAAEKRLLEEMPVIPLSFDYDLRLVQPGVRDWKINVLQRPDYTSAWLSPEAATQ